MHQLHEADRPGNAQLRERQRQLSPGSLNSRQTNLALQGNGDFSPHVRMLSAMEQQPMYNTANFNIFAFNDNVTRAGGEAISADAY